MIKLSRLARLSKSGGLQSLWLLVAALLLVLAVLWICGTAAEAGGGTPAAERAAEVPAHSAQDAGSSTAALASRSGDGPEIVASDTVTVFLPYIARNDWTPLPSVQGVQIWDDYDDNAEAEMKVAQAGARWVRLPIHWYYVEPTNMVPSQYQWSAVLDKLLASLAADHIQVILTLTGNPEWAATYRGGPTDRVDISELVEFMVAAVNRYGRPPYNVKYWEFYNEPDNGSTLYAEYGWGYWGNNGAGYAQMLAAVRGPMKAADPEAQIVFGGLAYDNWTSTGGPYVEKFLDDVLQAPGGGSFDVLNFHYYPAFRAHWEPYGPDIIGKANYLRNKLASYGLERPMICTELSQWSDAAHGGSDELQSRYVAQVFARSMAVGLKTAIWFELADPSPLISSWKYGLLYYDLTPKPSYQAYSTFAQQMGSAEYVRSLDTVETGSDQIEAYQFRRPRAPFSIIVAWTEDEQQHNLSLSTSQVVVVDKFGVETTVVDGDDGTVDGRVRVTIGPSPVYLRY